MTIEKQIRVELNSAAVFYSETTNTRMNLEISAAWTAINDIVLDDKILDKQNFSILIHLFCEIATGYENAELEFKSAQLYQLIVEMKARLAGVQLP